MWQNTTSRSAHIFISLSISSNGSVKSSHQERTAMANAVSDTKPGNSQQQCHFMICWSDGWLGGRMVPWLGGGTVGWARRWYVLLRARMFQWQTCYVTLVRELSSVGRPDNVCMFRSVPMATQDMTHNSYVPLETETRTHCSG